MGNIGYITNIGSTSAKVRIGRSLIWLFNAWKTLHADGNSIAWEILKICVGFRSRNVQKPTKNLNYYVGRGRPIFQLVFKKKQL